MITPPLPEQNIYNKHKYGYFGELGAGADAHLRFLQTALTTEELDSVTLIESIPGSETWDVRDLFQRDVDKERVTNDILPYLKDKTKVKFFNPLTLVLLPLAPNGQHIQRELPYVEPVALYEKEHTYTLFEWERHYKFGRHDAVPAFSYLHWNDAMVRVVAIDGQHRLSALKRWKNEPPQSSAEIAGWTIPVVILGIFRTEAGRYTTNFLDVVRKTFVYINSQAKEINPARETLLNDESVVAVCTQELIQASHSNDCLPLEERNESRLPLLMFDWRGETQDGDRVPSPGALKTVEELHDWLGWYLLGDDGSDDQGAALALEDLMPPLQTFGPKKKLSHPDAKRVREQFAKTVLVGFQHLLENFKPYQDYIAACRQIEREALRDSDLAQHAFMKLRFGTSRASEDILKDVQKKFEAIVQKFEQLKGRLLDELLARDVGMRAIVFAFGGLKWYVDEYAKTTSTWDSYARWFTPALNRVYADGWFRSHATLESTKRKLLSHVVFDPSGSIVNYKVEHVPDALGAMCAIVIARAGQDSLPGGAFDALLDDYLDALRSPLRAGYRRQYKAELQDEFRGKQADFKDLVQKKANAHVERHLNDLKRHISQPSQ